MQRPWDARYLQHSDVMTFVARELNALLLVDDVGLLSQHVHGVLMGTAGQPGAKASLCENTALLAYIFPRKFLIFAGIFPHFCLIILNGVLLAYTFP